MDDSLLDALPITVGTFRPRLEGGEPSSVEYACFVFDAPTVEGVPDLGEFACHISTQYQEHHGVKYAFWACSHVATGASFISTTHYTPFTSIAKMFSLLAEDPNAVHQSIQRLTPPTS